MNEDVNEIIKKIKIEMENIEIYYKICEKIINSYNIQYRNYEIIQNVNEIIYKDIINNINSIINDNNINKKYNKIIEIYNKMNEINKINENKNKIKK